MPEDILPVNYRWCVLCLPLGLHTASVESPYHSLLKLKLFLIQHTIQRLNLEIDSLYIQRQLAGN